MFIPSHSLHKPVSFLPQSTFAQIGILPENLGMTCDVNYTSAQQPMWDKLTEARLRVTEAKLKFKNIDTKTLNQKLSNKWDEQTIDTYRLQFRVIDLNEDGLIDFKELCYALDEIGDSSSEEERKRYFKEVDTDHSDGVDFEEFLELIERVRLGSAGSLGDRCLPIGSEVQNVMKIGSLSALEQIYYGLF